MQGASGLDCGNECNQVIFNSVWTDTECWKSHDTDAYRKSGYSKKFYEAHRDEIVLHKAAKEAFSKLPDGKTPKVKDLNEEFARLLSEKKAAYSEYKKIKKEMRDHQIAKQNVEFFYAAQQTWNQEEDLKKKRQQQR